MILKIYNLLIVVCFIIRQMLALTNISKLLNGTLIFSLSIIHYELVFTLPAVLIHSCICSFVLSGLDQKLVADFELVLSYFFIILRL